MKIKQFKNKLLLLLAAMICLSGCEGIQSPDSEQIQNQTQEQVIVNDSDKTDSIASWYHSVPKFRGTPYIEVNKNIPFFTEKEKKRTDAFEEYSDLDELRRCGAAYANLCEELMPVEEREDSLNSITPSGWHQNQYDGEWLLNRCHLIGYQLSGENANEKNLITGTRYFNVDGMLPFENTVAEYIHENPDSHVLFRVTPIYQDTADLMASGVLMEAWSVEDNGYGCQFCVYVYNVQPGVEIDYATGENWKDNAYEASADVESVDPAIYILNKNSKKFHTEDCKNGDKISDKNREEFRGERKKLLSMGYDSAGCCDP